MRDRPSEPLDPRPACLQKEILADIDACYASRPALAMVDSRKGITNLNGARPPPPLQFCGSPLVVRCPPPVYTVPSDVIIDASMPCVVRDSGRMWNRADKLEVRLTSPSHLVLSPNQQTAPCLLACLQDVKCIIPDRAYAGIYASVIADCKKHGQFSVSKMGSTANVGLMAQASALR